MVQGDEPMTHPAMISEAVTHMIKDPEIIVANLLGDIETIDEFLAEAKKLSPMKKSEIHARIFPLF